MYYREDLSIFSYKKTHISKTYFLDTHLATTVRILSVILTDIRCVFSIYSELEL